MDSHSVSSRVPSGVASKAVTIGGIVFANNRYDATADVLYVNVGDPETRWIGSGQPKVMERPTAPTGVSSA